MISGPRRDFEARCRERGYTLDDVRACIVAEHGDTITVEETHHAYPRAHRGPSLATKAFNLAASAARHVAAGMPRASDEEIERRFAICRACEHYDGAACRRCGCGISLEKRFLSKLGWAREKCPVGKWGPVAG